MSNKNKHNSIVFLTTLSVYLGLVLVGATPQVLAQVNSKSQNINLAQVNAKPIKDFGNKIRQLVKDGKLDLSKTFEIHFIAESINNKFVNPKFQLVAGDLLIDELQREWFKVLSDSQLLSDSSLIDTVSFDAKNDGKIFATNFSLKFKSVEIAKNLNSFFSGLLLFVPKRTQNYQTKLIAENTTVSSENNQVFIVTRLPRGSLEELLKNAKAESK